MRRLIVQSSQPTPDSSVSIVTLDIDVKRDDLTPSDFTESLGVLHDAKNAIFFESVTDLALERYE
jgi:ATP adenylyltransferase/5',5'''-P-1,P-4-tetraphosphate phosphorylase II